MDDSKTLRRRNRNKLKGPQTRRVQKLADTLWPLTANRKRGGQAFMSLQAVKAMLRRMGL